MPDALKVMAGVVCEGEVDYMHSLSLETYNSAILTVLRRWN